MQQPNDNAADANLNKVAQPPRVTFLPVGW